MKKQIAGVTLPVKSAGTRVSKTGSVTMIRAATTTRKKSAKSSRVVTVMSSHGKYLNFETAQKIGKIVSTPISVEQRAKAGRLATKAKTAQQSLVTARFRKQASA